MEIKEVVAKSRQDSSSALFMKLTQCLESPEDITKQHRTARFTPTFETLSPRLRLLILFERRFTMYQGRTLE
jgi:hypothetical protein